MIIQDLLREGCKELEKNRTDDAKCIARVLLAFLLNEDTSYILIHNDQELTDDFVHKYFAYIEKLKNGMPLQYITNKQCFMDIDFYVDENVLIPRPDTEILVEEVISIADKSKNIKILDMCTGSGAIAVSLARYLPNANVFAVDISDGALKIAKTNSKNAKVNVSFTNSNLFEKVEGIYDIIVSNPPYIKTSVIDGLSDEVKKEPIIALNGGIDGLDFYRAIAINAKKHLKSGGFLAVEIGYDQKDEVKAIFENEDYIDVYSKKDYGNNDRIVIGKSR